MADNNRNEQTNRGNAGQGQNQNPQQGGMNQEMPNDENPQAGGQWDNYQTRELSSEGEEKIEESDLLRADEVPGQKKDTTSDNQR